MELLYFAAFAFVIGLLFGSFMNVCLSRWPAGESIVKPGSHCRSCGHVLRWWENIPLLSWIVLRGRCRKCKAVIGWRYPAVELFCGFLFSTGTYKIMSNQLPDWHGLHFIWISVFIKCVLLMYFLWTLIALLFLDAENFWLPDRLTIPGIIIGLFLTSGLLDSIFVFLLYREPFDLDRRDITKAFLSTFAAGGLVLLIRLLYYLVRKQEGMGLGDAKLMAMLGAWLGWQRTLLSFVLGIFLAAAFALVLLFRGNPDDGDDSTKPAWALKQLPFGSFLCIGALLSYFFGGKLIALYLSAVGF